MPDHTTPRVLVADDQPDIVTALKLLLRDAGLETDTARSVQEVRTRLDACDYDLLLMDLNYARDTTSGREGLDLLDEVHSRDPLLPVVVMTGWASIDTAVEAMRRGARTFVHKPWNNAAMAAAITREVRDGIAQRHAQALAARQRADARASQRALLPSSLPPVAGCQIAARWNPASDLGGDCYDVMPLAPETVAISIADVCGKGLAAALVMSHLQASVRAIAAAHPAPPSLAASVNQVLCRNVGLAHFVTFFYATYDGMTRRLAFTNAGHNPPVLLRADGSVQRLATGGMVLGIFEHADFELGEVTLARGDRLVLFTDGIVEATGADGEYGDDRLVQLVRRVRAGTADQIADAIVNDVSAFTGGGLQDDATVMIAAIE